LASISDEAALAGGNLFALRGADGAWEILSAARAELVGTHRYHLSRLLRGLAATEPQAGRAAPPGSTLVRLDEGVVPLTTALSDLGMPWRYRVGPADRDHADPMAVEFLAAAGPNALKPLAPVHVRARRSSQGTEISWVRRTRRSGDAWEQAEVPLGEESEAYDVEVLQAGVAIRTFSNGSPIVLYPAADELADFGVPQIILSLRVAQKSVVAGRGFEAAVTVSIT
jgi:hypothetical protein